jgi:uncharacterized protein
VPYDDKERAFKFYRNVFGWNIEDIPEMGYAMAGSCECDEERMPKEKGVINGGLYKRDDNLSQNPVIVMKVASIDEYVPKIESAGGKVKVPKIQVGDMGFYSQIIDTEGNVIGIWEDIKK